MVTVFRTLWLWVQTRRHSIYPFSSHRNNSPDSSRGYDLNLEPPLCGCNSITDQPWRASVLGCSRSCPYGLESGDLNKLVPGPNGKAAKNVPCPDCLEKMFRLLNKDIQELQQKAGKPGCVVECTTIGFADDAAAVGLGLLSRTICTFLGLARG